MIVVEARDAAAKGLAAVTIEVDTNASGMFARPFPGDDLLLLLNGPPGAPIIVGVWDCRKEAGAGLDLVQTIGAKLAPPWFDSLLIGSHQEAQVSGEQLPAMTFITGDGPERTGWFAVRLERAGGEVLLGAGVGAGKSQSVSVEQIMANSAVGAAVRTLKIQ